MSVTTNIEFRPSDSAVSAVIEDGDMTATSDKRQDDSNYLDQLGFELVQDGILTGSLETFEVFGVVKKTYIVRESPNQSYVDTLTLDIPTKFYIDASLSYQAWVDQALPKSEKDRLSQLLINFIAGSMDKPEKFAAENGVDFESFIAEPYFVFTRSSKPPVLLDEYEKEVVAEMMQSERFTLQFKEQSVAIGGIETSFEGIDADNPNALQNYLTKQYEEVGCAEFPLEVVEHDIKKIIKYSEFRAIDAWVWIKIGCCKTKVWYPKVQARAAQKVVCVEVMSPASIENALKQILYNCGEKAAETSLAVAFVAWVTNDSLEKALIAFKAVFIECVEEKFGKLVECIVPVIVVKKRVLTGWKDAF